jgi:hypothetical protein
MKALTVVRLYWLFTVALLVGWCINLHEALAEPTVDGLDAAGVPLVIMIFMALIMLARARSKLSAAAVTVVRIRVGRYVVAGLAAAGLVAAVLLGFRVQG